MEKKQILHFQGVSTRAPDFPHFLVGVSRHGSDPFCLEVFAGDERHFEGAYGRGEMGLI